MVNSRDSRWLRSLAGWLIVGSAVGGPFLALGQGMASEEEQASAADPLARFGLHETTGAAAGYVEDRACRMCHRDLYDGYQKVGMARSFFRPGAKRATEDFENNHYFHEPSNRHYEMRRDGDEILFRRWQEDEDGQPINVFEQKVDWILGSGNRSRTYLYQTAGGELFQLPLAWYSQTGSWRMAPGFEWEEHQGLHRRVRRECMFCHNAYPEVAEGSDRIWVAQTFPEELPEGTGCQRCHGPGAEHVRVGLQEPVDFSRLRETVVHPGKIAPERRDDICNGCHLQPSVALFGVRRFGRGDYSYRPGEPLEDYMVPVDVLIQGEDRTERFEINHHPYRLRQSRCYLESAGAMSCMTCHDPHRKVPEEERLEHYRQACQSCHELDACRLEAMTTEARAALPAAAREIAANDCAGCHMPQRRPTDVVEVTMTDHLIRRFPGGEELAAALPVTEPVVRDVEILPLGEVPTGDLADLYRAAAVARAGGSASLDRLEMLLKELRPKDPEPYFDLVRGRLKKQQGAATGRALDLLLSVQPDGALGLEWKGLSDFQQGRKEEAFALIQRAVEKAPERPEGWFNLGLVVLSQGRYEEALEHLDQALALRSNLARGWFYKGNALTLLGRQEEALAAYIRSLELEPTAGDVYVAVARTALLLDRWDAARRYLRHGVNAAAKPEAVRTALAQFEAMERQKAEAPSPGR
ncbi:MAG: tetratricopeptide repeat protein [Acidobacteria bacterium]|nr:tetratricopeptide repeat protein [Acidobacteriota bacterium]